MLTDVIELIRELERFERAGGIGSEQWDTIPGFVSSGDGRAIFFSKKAERIISRIANQLQLSLPSTATSHTDHEWRNFVRSSLGPPLAGVGKDQSVEHGAAEVLRLLVSVAKAEAAQDRSEVISFGATLVTGASIANFQIGPVQFHQRDAWLERQHKQGRVSALSKRRVQRAWRCAKLLKRRPSVEAMSETDLLDAIGSDPYVCSVRCNGLAASAALTKAKTAAHLAFASISLMWDRPSRSLSGMHLSVDAGSRHEIAFVERATGMGFASRTLTGLPHGPRISQEEWNTQSEIYRRPLDLAGSAIGTLVSPGVPTPRPKVMAAVFQALLWFYEGCKESIDAMAVVKFVSVLDALTGGQQESGILRLLTTQLGIQDNIPLFHNGIPIKKLINEMYRYGRSRTVHGTNDRISHDWSVSRERAEKVARLGLILSMSQLSEHPEMASLEGLQQSKQPPNAQQK